MNESWHTCEFSCLTWKSFHMCDMTHSYVFSYVWHDSFIWENMSYKNTCIKTHMKRHDSLTLLRHDSLTLPYVFSYVWHVTENMSRIWKHTWLIHMRKLERGKESCLKWKIQRAVSQIFLKESSSLDSGYTLQHTATHCNTLQHIATQPTSVLGSLPYKVSFFQKESYHNMALIQNRPQN